MTINLRAPGQYHDRETGWYYNGQRYYIPALYRYNRPEPIGQAGSLDLYMYAGGNPVMMVDPTGLNPEDAAETFWDSAKALLHSPIDIAKMEYRNVMKYGLYGGMAVSLGEAVHGSIVGLAELAGEGSMLIERGDKLGSRNADRFFGKVLFGLTTALVAGKVSSTYGELNSIQKSMAGLTGSEAVAEMRAITGQVSGFNPASVARSASAPIPKFAEYIFDKAKYPGKSAPFEGLGYGKDQSSQLAQMWEQQAATKYASGDFNIGYRDIYGQRINIEIVVPGIGEAIGKTSYMKSGWIILPDGSIKLATPFSGFTR